MTRPKPPSSPILFGIALTVAVAACSTNETPKTNVTIPSTGLVVVNSDYTSTSVSLIDPATRARVHDDCVDSNTAPPTLSLALSGDVRLPTSPQIGGDVVLIDDVNSALTWVNPQTCAIRHQISISTFASLPHDVVSASADKAYVTRFGTNSTPTDDPMSRGEDLVILNLASTPDPTIVGRIDLAPFAAPVAGSVIQARPDAGLIVGGNLYVTLASQSANYAATGVGRIVVVDTATDAVSGMIDLPGLAGCSRMQYQSSTKTLLVACGGASSEIDQSATSGVALIDLGGAAPVVKKVLPASGFGAQPLHAPLNFSWVAAVAGGQVWAATFGAIDFNTNAQLAPDKVWSIAGDSGTGTSLLEGGAFNLGRAALVDGSAPALFLPDADPVHPLVHVLGAAGVSTPPVDIDANPSQHLPPREVAWY
jgi:hypothetical protein